MTTVIEQLVDECQETIARRGNITEMKQHIVQRMPAIKKHFRANKRAGIETLFVSEKLTVLNVVWQPKMTMPPHNHNVWAIIGVYSGREDNTFWRRVEENDNGKIKKVGQQTIAEGEVVAMPASIIHSVHNPLSNTTGAIHVYGGDFFSIERSNWDSAGEEEKPYELSKNMALFE